jgi:hypothetical protein
VALIQFDRRDPEHPGPIGLVADRILERASCVLFAEEEVDRLWVAESIRA